MKIKGLNIFIGEKKVARLKRKVELLNVNSSFVFLKKRKKLTKKRKNKKKTTIKYKRKTMNKTLKNSRL